MVPAGVRETSGGWCSILGLAAVGILCHPFTCLKRPSRRAVTGTERVQLLGEGHVAGVTCVIGGETQPTCSKPPRREHRKLTFVLPLIYQSPSLAEFCWTPEGREVKWDSPYRSAPPRHRAGWRSVQRGRVMKNSQHGKTGQSWGRTQWHPAGAQLSHQAFLPGGLAQAHPPFPRSRPRDCSCQEFFRTTILS